MTADEREQLRRLQRKEIQSELKCRWCGDRLTYAGNGRYPSYCDLRCRRNQKNWMARRHLELSKSEVGRMNINRRWEDRLR